jgi:hypothetical protein
MTELPIAVLSANFKVMFDQRLFDGGDWQI